MSINIVRYSSGNKPSAPLSFADAPLDLLSDQFLGRDGELSMIQEAFNVRVGNRPIRYAIYGMSGIGKTQTALQYAQTSFDRQRYAVVFWMSADSIEKLYQGFSKVLHLVDHADRNHPEENVRLTATRRWLEECSENWLVILDNLVIETIEFLREHLPHQNSKGHILCTTRAEDAANAFVRTSGQRYKTLGLQCLDLQDAANLLLQDTIDPSPIDITNAKELVRSVGCLPLAIAQAASFISQSHNSLEVVLTLYQSEQKVDVSTSSL